MFRSPCIVSLCLGVLVGQDPAAPDPRQREFDFWVGEWDVNNRRLGEAGYRDAGKAKARIRPILGGAAILEEWDGQPGGHEHVFGISIRHYDPEKGRWVIALNWPNPRQAGFSHMEGSFRHGRAEFFPETAFQQTPPRATRFTFSDALADSVRWDMAQPVDGGGWKTTWIMEFSRTRSAADTIADGEPIREAPAPGDCVCRWPEARQFDRFVGAWSGTVGAARATLRVTSTNRGCATMCFLEVERPTARGVARVRRFEAWAWNTAVKKWAARALDDVTPEFQVLAGGFDDAGVGAFVRTDRDGEILEQTRRVTYRLLDDGHLSLRHETSGDGGETWGTELEFVLAPAR